LVMVSGGNWDALVRRSGRMDTGATNVDVSIDYFPFVRLGDYDAVYSCGCVGHGGAWNC
jgi:hypothetical protein